MPHATGPFEVFPFRYRDPRTGKWVGARYKATREDIAARYVEWELTGGRGAEADARNFKPHRGPAG